MLHGESVYIYFGSARSAHSIYLKNSIKNNIKVVRFNKSLRSILMFVLRLFWLRITHTTVISSSPAVIVIAKICNFYTVFDCHGSSKFLKLLSMFKPSQAVSNSKGTQLYLKKLGIESKAWLPSVKVKLQSKNPIKNKSRVYSDRESIPILIAGHIDEEFRNFCPTHINLDGESKVLEYHHFGRTALSYITDNYNYYGFQNEEDIKKFCEHAKIEFGMIFYSKNHKQRAFMSPLKCDFYDSLNINVLIPDYFPVIHYNDYVNDIYKYSITGKVEKVSMKRVVPYADSIIQRLGLQK
jgi:hypothetical protein